MEADATTQTTNSSARFFCHSCNSEIDRISSDFKCPQCLDGFIEELPPQSPSSNEASSSAGDLNVDNQVLRFANEIFSNPLLTPILMSTSGARPGDAFGESSSDGGSNIGRRGLRRDFNITNFDTILQDILVSVGAAGDAQSLFFSGNPGDYAWGREGLDTIVTQLLNQMDNTGPPPLEKEKIDVIPQVLVEPEQVGVQCSVCWEDFKLDESVRKLPCTHLYHENCIVPWLQCHGTCPICRQSLVNENGAEQQRISAAAQLIRNVTSVMRPSSSTSQDTASTSATTSTAVTANNSRGALFSPSSFLAPSLAPFPPIVPSTVAQPSQNAVTANSTLAPSSQMDRSHVERDSDGNIDYDFD